MTNKDQSREAFEAWARGLPENVNLIREGSGYRYVYAECSWAAWQAARSAPAAPVELPEPFALYDGEKWYANEEAAICSCANMQKLQKIYTEQQVRELLAAASKLPQGDGWLPIESAPKDKTILLGYRNTHGNWRTLRGEWFSREEIDEFWEDPDGVEPGWFETSVEADDVPNVWRTEPTHWMPLPQPPKEQG